MARNAPESVGLVGKSLRKSLTIKGIRMSINNTTYTFKQIADEVAPEKYDELQQSKAYLVTKFGVKNQKVKSLIEELALPFESDFKGLYVFYEADEPIYVGISKNVLKRVRQHVKCANQSDCDVALYLTEVYIAMQLNTHIYNSFETH